MQSQVKPPQPQPQPRASSRVMKPSQQQQTRAAAQSRSSAPSSTKPKAASAAPPSVLTRDRLHTNLKYYQFLTRVQHLLIDAPAVTPSTLQRASLVLRPVDYEEITQERSNDGRCGWPSCSNEVQRATSAHGRYRLSMRQQRVWEVEGGQRYCSEQCEEASAEYAVQLNDEPLYMRRLGHSMSAIQQDEQKQHSQQHDDGQQLQDVQQLLASLPAHNNSTSHSSYDALRDALPLDADTSALVIKENSEESVQTVISGQSAAAAMAGHNQQRSKQQPQFSQQQNPQSTSPLPSPPTGVGKLGAASAVLRKVHHLPSAPRTAAAENATLEEKVLPSVVDTDEENELLDSIARTAISEKAKLNQTLNRVSDATRNSAEPLLNDVDSDLPSSDEAKQNFAAMRRANPLSPFAQLAGLLTHFVTDDTVALLRSKASTDVTPASSELVRRRQEALLGWLHAELRFVREELAVRSTRSVENAVDAVVMTFLLNEAVPALPSRLWQVVVTVILLTLHRRTGGGATFDMNEQAVSKFVASRGFSDLQMAALMDIILPAAAAIPQPGTITHSSQPAITKTAAISAGDPSSAFVPDCSLLSMPRYLLSSALSFLSSSDLSSASLVSSHFLLLCHPLRQHSDERTLLAHNNSLTATRMHTMGYREGVQEGRELLMQAGFDAGVEQGWRSGRQEEWRKGMVGALAMWNERQPGQAATSAAVGWSATEAEWLWQQCERVNGAVMRRPRERGGRGAISNGTSCG